MASTPKGIVYTLTDPRDHTIRYVGQTTQPLDARLVGHVTAPTNVAMRVWINKLVKRGLTPRITAIATARPADLDAEEKRQILKHIDAGHRLFNAPYYKANMADLVADGARPGRGALAARRREVFGAIASARAAGKMTRRAAAPRIAIRIPQVVLLSAWDGIRASRLCRRLAAAGVVIYGGWCLGFDLIIRHFVLANIPAGCVLAFWHNYLAHPLENLALLFAAGLLLGGWFEYLQAAQEAGVPSLLSSSLEEA